MTFIKLILFTFLVFLCTFCTAKENISAKMQSAEIPQFVLFSFDGGYELAFWKDSLSFAEEEGIKFTYFISGSYYITQGTYGVRNSNIAFGNPDDISERLNLTRIAKDRGHEIASHGMTHFMGTKYSAFNWQSEFELMDKATKEIIFPADKTFQYAGYRSPYLTWNTDLFSQEIKSGMRYDSSQYIRKECASVWPYEVVKGILEFPIRQWTDANGLVKSTMDFHSLIADRNETDTAKIRKITAAMYLDLFEHLYNSSRAPLVILTHFGADRMRDAAYYAAMKDFAANVCKKELVRCVTISTAAEWIRKNSEWHSSLEKPQAGCITESR